jgi:hypothetical protein
MAYVRPRSLAEVARAARRDGDIYGPLREFLDFFYTHPRERKASLAREPALLDDRVANAYLAAAAEHLALRYRQPMPAWALKPDRFLHQAYFGGPDGMKAILLVESPSAFRRRMIFVDHDPLGRPLRKGLRPQPPAWGPRAPASAAKARSA